MADLSVSTPSATREFLLALSNLDSDRMGTCEVCGHDSERLVELFPAPDDGPLIPDDRLVCAQCLLLGVIATKLEVTHADLGQEE